MADGIDYGQFDAGRHLDYWDLGRTLQRELRRAFDAEEYEWAAPRLSAFGAVVGGTVGG